MILRLIKQKCRDPFLSPGVRGVCLYLNPETYLHYRKNPAGLSEVSLLRFDGILFSTLNKLCLSVGTPRRSFDFTSLADFYFSFLAAEEKRIVIIGATDAELEKFKTIVESRYPGLNVVATYSGFGFRLEMLCERDVDFFLVGMGGLLQDNVAIRISEIYPDAQIMTCGGFISQTARAGGYYYPKFIDAMNIRFLYRFWKEPRIFRRVIVKYPIFLAKYLLDVFGYLKNGKR